MDADDRKGRLDSAFDRIEETILPSIGSMLDSLLEAAEAAGAETTPRAYAAQLRMLALQLETLTREIESLSPARLDAGGRMSVSGRRR